MINAIGILFMKIKEEIIPMLFGTVVLIGQKQNLKRVYTSMNPRIFIPT
jgi:hypothetical protein